MLNYLLCILPSERNCAEKLSLGKGDSPMFPPIIPKCIQILSFVIEYTSIPKDRIFKY